MMPLHDAQQYGMAMWRYLKIVSP